MDHKETIEEGLKTALKQRDSSRVSVLRMLMSSIKYKEVEKGRPLSEDEFHGVVKTLIKQRSESIESFKKGQRLDLVDKEEKELEVLKTFVPAPLSEAEVAAAIEEAVVAADAKGPKDMGKVMKSLMDTCGSRVDGKVLSEMVKKRLSS
ncbi:MAG TPA: glutamyl-tRNA amidotransferase [Deltaproteobacteria bacterium]|nr:glutamyl-tRNA amidotransferase [Deltaproteobacteria bacterium]